MIPLAIHGDDGESHRRRSFCITTFCSLTAEYGQFWDNKFLISVEDNSQCTIETHQTLSAWVAWSITELQLGHFLDIGPFQEPYPRFHHGRSGPIAGSYRGILVVHKGDEKFIQKEYHTSRSWVSKSVCLLCGASRHNEQLLYTHFGPQAAHRQCKVTSETFISQISRTQTFTRIPGWSIFLVQHDWLHVVDLSIIPECAASALMLGFALLCFCFPGKV